MYIRIFKNLIHKYNEGFMFSFIFILFFLIFLFYFYFIVSCGARGGGICLTVMLFQGIEEIGLEDQKYLPR